MTEVRADDECVGGVFQIGSKERTKGTFSGCGSTPDHDWHERRVFGGGLIWVLELQEPVDVGKMELYTVFIFVDGS